jgi:hypothetical protein
LIFKRFDLVVWAVGFGRERTTIPDPAGGTISGIPFWATDQLQDPQCGILASKPDVLILGSGDGALQDFLRAATRLKSAREIYDQLQIPEMVRHAAQDIEAEFHRGFVWCERDEDERRLYAARHSAYEDLVNQLWEDETFVRRSTGILRDDIASVAVGYPSNFLTGFYGLNCFLALIIGRAWAEREGSVIAEVLRAGWRARHAQYYPLNAPPGYDVTLDREPGCPLLGAGPIDIRTCHLLVIRLGIDSAPAQIPWWSSHVLPLPARPRHLYPNHLPV